MWLFLCSPDDLPGLWAYRKLRNHHQGRLRLVTPEEMGAAPTWEHRVGAGATSCRIVLDGGDAIDGSRLQGVINRMTRAPQFTCDPQPAQEDLDYAAREGYAMVLSWLTALPCPLLNPPSPRGLCGAWRGTSEWLQLGRKAGLSVLPLTLGAPPSPPPDGGWRRLLVIDGALLAEDPAHPPPEAVAEGCLHLSRLARSPLMQVWFHLAPDCTWRFGSASPLPDLSLAGERGIAALARRMAA